ncbi:hypothetical protein B0O80DRAFT_499822 [Mortierella sp. GBAus27b]|nr:hypothetical protein B0O80DRAFT_499822 [Mortierella sp. GBAus27b]
MISSSADVSLTRRPSPFDIPELAELIAQNLTNHDIVQCMATSKTLVRQLEPFLWRHVVLKWSLPAPPTFERNRHWIQSLSISVSRRDSGGLLDVVTCHSSNDPTPVQRSSYETHHSIDSPQVIGCTGYYRLQSIHIDIDKSTKCWTNDQRLPLTVQTLRILQHSPNLTHITLPERFLSIEHDHVHVETFLDTLEHKLPHLQQLILNDGFVEYDVGLRLFSVCFNHPQLTDLRCGFAQDFRDLESPDELFTLLNSLLELIKDSKAKATVDRPAMGTRIKTLILPRSINGYTADFLCTLLKGHLPNIERFYFDKIYNFDDMELTEPFRDAIAQGCPNLQHIEFVWNRVYLSTNEVLKGIILGCKGLKSFCGNGFEDTHKIGDFYGIKTLLDYHPKTLEVVDLRDCKNVASRDIARLFQECRNLRRVRITPHRHYPDVLLHLEDMANKEWICHDLEELHIYLSRRFSNSGASPKNDSGEGSDRADNETRIHQLVKKAFGQIGQLSKLETLSLCSVVASPTPFENKDLTLDRGGLSELAGLKRLRHFDMAERLWLGVGQAEVEFMDVHWPLLEKVTFGFSNFSRLADKPCWQWLQARRPCLKYGSWPVEA